MEHDCTIYLNKSGQNEESHDALEQSDVPDHLDLTIVECWHAPNWQAFIQHLHGRGSEIGAINRNKYFK